MISGGLICHPRQAYRETVRNITVTVNDEIYHRARVRAAQQRTTLSALVRAYLERLTEEEPAFERLQREQNDLIARIRAEHPGFSATDRLTREQAHRRDAVR
jgi:hypothetical protein